MCDFPDHQLEEEFENGWSENNESISESSKKESIIDLLNSFVQTEKCIDALV